MVLPLAKLGSHTTLPHGIFSGKVGVLHGVSVSCAPSLGLMWNMHKSTLTCQLVLRGHLQGLKSWCLHGLPGDVGQLSTGGPNWSSASQASLDPRVSRWYFGAFVTLATFGASCPEEMICQCAMG